MVEFRIDQHVQQKENLPRSGQLRDCSATIALESVVLQHFGQLKFVRLGNLTCIKRVAVLGEFCEECWSLRDAEGDESDDA